MPARSYIFDVPYFIFRCVRNHQHIYVTFCGIVSIETHLSSRCSCWILYRLISIEKKNLHIQIYIAFDSTYKITFIVVQGCLWYIQMRQNTQTIDIHNALKYREILMTHWTRALICCTQDRKYPYNCNNKICSWPYNLNKRLPRRFWEGFINHLIYILNIHFELL